MTHAAATVFAREPAPGRWFVVLDAARSPQVLPCLAASGERHASLYDGWKAHELAEVAPYLVEVSERSALWHTLLGDAWGDAWGVWVRSDATFDDLRRHLRRFLRVQGEDGRRMLFRWYDPRVLRAYLPTCTPEERRVFHGPVRAFVVESGAADVALRFTAAQGPFEALRLGEP